MTIRELCKCIEKKIKVYHCHECEVLGGIPIDYEIVGYTILVSIETVRTNGIVSEISRLSTDPDEALAIYFRLRAAADRMAAIAWERNALRAEGMEK